ncbi:hypothetical protein ALC60_05221 [Trachymyrmex zeteki]|uniref:Uncharacterized protein n=1 Tax=Mycetomoellerius zeteki TaxID=64791 RepID=A0A151X6M3_9HYME|nr:hypothetical protein ALC60_05221 [Trachymyrmex zeteki]
MKSRMKSSRTATNKCHAAGYDASNRVSDAMSLPPLKRQLNFSASFRVLYIRDTMKD